MNELAKRQSMVSIRGGTELWIDEDRVQDLEKALQNSNNKFIKISGQLVNVFEVLGVFSVEAIEERQRRKNGEWKCQKGKWHEKFKICECKDTYEVTAIVQGIGEIKYQKDR